MPISPLRLFLMLLALTGLMASGAAATRVTEPPLVAVFELEAPSHSPFTLHGTLPIPKGVYPREDGKTPFVVRSRGAKRELVPAQVQIVSRYPTGEADVVELIARVAMDRGDKPGARIEYEVLMQPSEPLPARKGVAPRNRALLDPQAGGKLALRARDVFGNEYRLDLLAKVGTQGVGSIRDEKRGHWLVERRIAGALAPYELEADARGVLPHFLGVHAYLGQWRGEPAVSLDLRLHNGTISADGSVKPLGIVYWQSLELIVPRGYVVVPELRDPFFGEPYDAGDERVYPIVKPFEDGALHMMGPQAQFVRRLAIAPEKYKGFAHELVDEQGLAFCTAGPRLWSWFDSRTARYFPQRDLLAGMDFYTVGGTRGKKALREHEASRYADIRAQLESGRGRAYPREGRVMGWAHPWFQPAEGPPGGEDIHWIEGHRAAAVASRESYLRNSLLHRFNSCRQPQAVYDLAGEPLGVEAWTRADGSLPFQFRPYGRGVIPAFALPCFGGPQASAHVRAVVAQGRRPEYDRGRPFDPKGGTAGHRDDLLSWMPHDGAHIVRYTKNAKALAWLGNDSLAKDDLRMYAELFLLYFHTSPGKPGSWRFPTSLWQMERFAAQHPHRGLAIHREHGWGIDAFCSAYSFAGDAWRAKHRPWAERTADLLELGATPGGLINRGECPPLRNGAVDGCLSFHNEILLLGHRSLVESVFRGVDPVRVKQLEAGLLRAADYLFFGPAFVRMRESWSDPDNPIYKQGPAWAIPMAPADDSAPPYSDTQHWGRGYLPQDVEVGGPEAEYGFAVLSFAADATQRTHGRGLRNHYFRRALDLSLPTDTWPEKFDSLVRQVSVSSYDTTPSTIGFLGRLQVLGADR